MLAESPLVEHQIGYAATGVRIEADLGSVSLRAEREQQQKKRGLHFSRPCARKRIARSIGIWTCSSSTRPEAARRAFFSRRNDARSCGVTGLFVPVCGALTRVSSSA